MRISKQIKFLSLLKHSYQNSSNFIMESSLNLDFPKIMIICTFYDVPKQPYTLLKDQTIGLFSMNG